MLAQQQVRLLTGLSRLLNRLLRGLLWHELTAVERRRILALLSHLDSDVTLALSIAEGGKRAEGRHDEMPPLLAEESGRLAVRQRRGQEARPGRVLRALPGPGRTAHRA